VLAVAAATLGSLVAAGLKKVSHLGLCLLISFAAGALLAVSLFDILPETFEAVGVLKGLVSFGSGYLLFFLITKFVFHICPACSATHSELNFKAITTTMVVALSIHSFMDGLAIASGSSSGSAIGLLILLAVVYHKFPEGMALTLVGISSGMGRAKALLMSCFIEGSTTLVGGLVGFLIPMTSNASWTGYVLGHVGGGFVFLVLHALLSEVVKHHPRYTILSAVLGGLSILAVQFFIL
jgi:zinc transporter ZupT